jgi:hypothetical protein
VRTALLLILTIALLVGGFVAYVWLQPAGPAQPPLAGPGPLSPATMPDQPTGQLVGPAAGVWVSQYDENNRLKSRFRFARSVPSEQGRLFLERPEAEFIIDQRVLRITGREGLVVRAQSPGGSDPRPLGGSDAGLEMPSRGQLTDVTLFVYDTPEQAERDDPRLTVKTHNASFDNDTYRIATDGYTDAGGGFVPGDQVPVLVRGQDVDFSGRGLIIRWNDVDQQLDLLEITHGESMVIRNPDALMAQDDKAQPKARPTTRDRPATTSQATMPARRAQPTYRASFEDNLRISRGSEPIVVGDVMAVDLLLDPDQHGEASAEGRKAPTSARSAGPATATAAVPPPQPITITWTGRLRVVPLQTPPEPPLAAGQALARITGSPVTLTEGTRTALAASLVYRTDTGLIALRGSDALPSVTLSDTGGSRITTQLLEYSLRNATATLHGASHSIFASSQGEEPITAEWTDSATIRFAEGLAAGAADGSGHGLALEKADFSGAVHVKHPRLELQGDQLGLAFAATAPQGEAQLQRTTARGGVRAKLASADGGEQTLAGDELAIDLAQSEGGELYPQTIEVDGHVVATDGPQVMRAGHVRGTFRPTTLPASDRRTDQPKLEIASLDASGSVSISEADQPRVQADQVLLDDRPEGRVIQLIGQPARLFHDQDVLAGPLIRYMPGEQRMEVIGPGTLHAVPQRAGAQPVDLAWKGQVQAAAATDLIEVSDDVLVTMADAEGMLTTAQARRAQVRLRSRVPATNPTTVRAEPSGSGLLGGDAGAAMLDKEPVSVALLDDVRLESAQRDADGAVLRRVYLSSSRASYDLRLERLDIPAAGQMLVEDHRPESNAQRRGATAFGWSKSLTYSGVAAEAEMLGDVLIRHLPDDPEGRPFSMQTELVRAEMARSSTRPATTDALGGDELDLRRVLAEGAVRVVSDKLTIEGEQAEYFPPLDLLIARGSAGRPLYFHDAASGSDGTAEQLRVNTRTGESKVERLQTQIRN